MLPEERIELMRAQTALAQALRGAGPIPPGFDENRVLVAATALQNKRMRSAMKHLPDLRQLIGKDFQRLFRIYASDHQPAGTAGEDAENFFRFVRRNQTKG